MGRLFPVADAFFLFCYGVQFFRDPKEVGPGPLVSTYIFIFATFLLLWDIRLYPKSLRKLGCIGQYFVEFLVAAFLFETITMDFWFPLEAIFLTTPAKLGDAVDDMMQTGGWPLESVSNFLKDTRLSFIASYLLSTFFLITVLHAIRAIDLRELENGPTCFFKDILYRFKRFLKKKKRTLGFGAKKKVHIKEYKRCPSKSSTEYCYPNVDHRSHFRQCSKKKKNPCESDLKQSFSDFEMALKQCNI